MLPGWACVVCAQTPVLYNPGPPASFTTAAATVDYRDAANDTRTLSLTIRRPNVTGALPVVVWSHSAVFPSDALFRWSEATAQAGYLTIVVSHPTRDVAQAVRLCEALQVDEEACRTIGLVNWDRPQDLKQVLDWLERNRENVDVRRVALAGHADGASAAVSLAGAKRLLTSTERRKADDFTDRRPVAFVALSPHGPVREGFFDAGWRAPESCWAPVTRPVLVVTGAGDNNCDDPGTCRQGDSAARRRIVFDAMPEGGKYLMFVRSLKVSHELLGSLDPAVCGATGAECEAFERWMRSSVVAFLDAHVRQLPAAQAWLKEMAAGVAALGDVEWGAK